MRDALFTSPKLADAMSRNTFEMPPGVVGTGDLLDVLQGFVHELRAAGLPVSMTENLDAMRAIEHVPLSDRTTLRTALGATLVKQAGHARGFDTIFEVYFSMFSPGVPVDEASGDAEAEAGESFDALRGAMEAAGAMGDLSDEDLARLLLDALMRMDRAEIGRAHV